VGSVSTVSVLGDLDIDPKPVDHCPDTFEQRFGVVGSTYVSPEGRRRIKDRTLVECVEKPTRTEESRSARVLGYLEAAGWGTKAQISSGAKMQLQATSIEVERLYKEDKLHRADIGKAHFYFLPGCPMPAGVVKYRKFGDEK
jgi:hypothetical protein